MDMKGSRGGINMTRAPKMARASAPGPRSSGTARTPGSKDGAGSKQTEDVIKAGAMERMGPSYSGGAKVMPKGATSK